jgi:hypothetical protein
MWTVVFQTRLALAAGVCTIAAGIWKSTEGKYWLLVLNGLALAALGLIFNGIFGFRINFRTFALLIILMAMSMGILELETAQTLRCQRDVTDGWFLGLAGAASVSFALAFFALGLGGIELEAGPAQTCIGWALTLVLAQSACWGLPHVCTAWVLLNPASIYTPQFSGVLIAPA